jgi:hypothetical protein
MTHYQSAGQNMTVLVGHPTGNPISYNAATAYLEAGLLECFCVSWMPSTRTLNMLSSIRPLQRPRRNCVELIAAGTRLMGRRLPATCGWSRNAGKWCWRTLRSSPAAMWKEPFANSTRTRRSRGCLTVSMLNSGHQSQPINQRGRCGLYTLGKSRCAKACRCWSKAELRDAELALVGSWQAASFASGHYVVSSLLLAGAPRALSRVRCLCVPIVF